MPKNVPAVVCEWLITVFTGSPDLSIFEIPAITHPDTSDRWRRSHRPHLSDPEWPPKANENWMEIMVVADGPMVQYHGDKLEQYILTLMQIVSSLDCVVGNHN